MKPKIFVLLISLIAAFGGLLFGFDIAVFSGTIPFIRPHFRLTEAQLGWTGSSLYVGCIAGSVFTGYLAEKFGRKIPLIMAAAIFVVSSVMMGWASTYGQLIFWRILAGVGVGAASMLSPMYIAEISPPSIRGKMVSINQLTIVIGILLAYFSNFLLSEVENNWRWMFTSGAVPAFLFFILVFILPESPRWLIAHSQKAKALKILRAINGEAKAEDELASIAKVISQEVRVTWTALTKPGSRHLLLLGVTLAVFQQISGANAVFFYAPIIFEKAGMDVGDQLFQQILIGAINLVFTLVAMQLVDRIGRKKLMLAGSSLMALWLALVGICYHYSLFDGYLLQLLVLAFIATYATTLAPVTWVLISEIFPTRIRSLAVSVSTCMLWVACFALAYAFPVLVEVLSAPQTFYLFGFICLVYFFILLRYAPETKGKTLEQVELSGLTRH